MGKATKPYHRGAYVRRAALVRAIANADPSTTCARCGLTARPGDPWTAGHARDADPTSPLFPEHRSCNYAAGAAMGNRRRATPPPSRRW